MLLQSNYWYSTDIGALLSLFKSYFTKNKILLSHLQGANASALEKEIGSEQFPVNEHYFGLVNVSK